MKLPPLKFTLPEWKPSDFENLEHNKKKIVDLLGKTGRGSDKFRQSCDRIKKLVRQGLFHALPYAINTSTDVRALTYLFAQQADFRNFTSITKEMLDSLYNPRPILGRISLFQLISVFFLYFDQIGDERIFTYFCQMLETELSKHALNPSKGEDLLILANHRKMIFTPQGPANVVNFALIRNIDLDVAFKQLALHGYHDSRFQRLCRYHYYLETLKKLPVGTSHPILAEVCKSDVYDAPSREGKLLGHEILSILIDKALPNDISAAWQGVILTIAGDPRVPETSHRFQKWWAILGLKRIQKVRGWLSKFDLLLFLDALKNYGETSGNTDMQRMFRARKVFLEGLQKQGLIKESRLFVGSGAERFLKSNFKKDELPNYAQLSDSSKSIIYLQVGNCHILEGSHSFKLWIFTQLPSNSDIRNYSRQSYHPRNLSYDIQDKLNAEFNGKVTRPAAIVHHPNLGWQDSAIKYLKQEGIRLDIDTLFTREDYREYKWKYGL